MIVIAMVNMIVVVVYQVVFWGGGMRGVNIIVVRYVILSHVLLMLCHVNCYVMPCQLVRYALVYVTFTCFLGWVKGLSGEARMDGVS